MGMDIFGNSGNYFRANIWEWTAICYAITLAGHPLPESWQHNDGDGLATQQECDVLAGKLDGFLAAWQGERIVYDEGVSVDPATPPPVPTGHLRPLVVFLTELTRGPINATGPGSCSPYFTSREHLREFITFLRNCGGFEIH